MQIGYARVSTDAQDLTTQRELLAAAGCQRIFAEKITGTRADRPELARRWSIIRAGDVVTVTSLDRLARSTRDLLDIAEAYQAHDEFLKADDDTGERLMQRGLIGIRDFQGGQSLAITQCVQDLLRWLGTSVDDGSTTHP